MKRAGFSLLVLACILMGCAAKRNTQVCPDCWGTGRKMVSDERCWFCKGGATQGKDACPMCGGSGFESEQCLACGGRGWTPIGGPDSGQATSSSETSSSRIRSDAAKITNIAVDSAAGGTKVRIKYEGNVRFRVGQKANPERYFVDVVPAVYTGQETSWEVSQGGVSKVMAAELGISEPTCRIMLYLLPKANATVISSAQELVIEVTPSQ